MMVEGTKILTTWTWKGETFSPHGYDTAGQERHAGAIERRGAICEFCAAYEGGFAGTACNAFCIASISVPKVRQSPLFSASNARR